jgi:hypothetical protein
VSAYQSLALEHMKEMRVRRMPLGTRQRFPVQAGTGAKAPLDLPCEMLTVFVEVGFGGVWFRWVRLPYLYSVTYLVMV